MSDIRQVLQQLKEPLKTIGQTLIEFDDNMRKIDNDPEKAGKKATAIIMAMNDIMTSIEKHLQSQYLKVEEQGKNHKIKP